MSIQLHQLNAAMQAQVAAQIYAAPVSKCCGAPMRVGGAGATHWHECCACGKATDAAEPVKRQTSGQTSGNGSGISANRRRSAASKRGASARASVAKAQAEHKAEAVRARIEASVACGEWTREHAFAAECEPPRKWRFDFACVARKVALEVEGGIWSKGRAASAHARPLGILRDIEKGNAATALGWRVIRCQPGSETAAETLRLLARAVVANLTLP